MIFLAGLEVHERQKGGPLLPHCCPTPSPTPCHRRVGRWQAETERLRAVGVGYSPAFDDIQEIRSKILAHNRREGFILVAATEAGETPTVAYRHTDQARANDYSSVYAVRSVWFHH